MGLNLYQSLTLYFHIGVDYLFIQYYYWSSALRYTYQ
nr:MAG TPA: hypothetical protein [Caudoviricetes sp.]DAU16631.1 MAG TPA: hypothetical protein [Caudoviricetes sp.]